jgi:hypothetical protein
MPSEALFIFSRYVLERPCSTQVYPETNQPEQYCCRWKERGDIMTPRHAYTLLVNAANKMQQFNA